MKLADLPLENARFDPRFAGLELAGIAADSRKVKPGDLFVAVPGTRSDGLGFVPQALAAGAAAIMAERPAQVNEQVPDNVAVIQVANARRALALAAAAFFPRQPATIAAVTGTSGKTSVAAFTRQIWEALGEQAASIGTIGVVSPGGEQYGSLTTPDPIELHRTLDALAGEGVTHLALEASSHGLDQHRLDGVRVTAGAFTNLSRDHLDYHATLEAYLAAKLRLFSDLIVAGGTAVIGVDDCYAGQVVAAAEKRGLKIMTVGVHGEDIKLLERRDRRLRAARRRSRMAAAPTTSGCRWSAPSRWRMRPSPPAFASPPAAIRRASFRRSQSSKAPRAAWSSRARRTARPSSSTMRTSRTH